MFVGQVGTIKDSLPSLKWEMEAQKEVLELVCCNRNAIHTIYHFIVSVRFCHPSDMSIYTMMY